MEPLVVKPGQNQTISPMGGDLSFWMARGSQTRGAYAMMEQSVPPGHGPRKHVHTREDEAFYILEGEFGFEVGDHQFIAGAGTFVLGPRNIPHRFWNAGETPSRFLLILSPPGLEPFFEEFSRMMAEPAHDLARQAEVAGRYGIEFV